MLEAGHKLGMIVVTSEHFHDCGFAGFKLRDFVVSCSSAHFAVSGRHSTGLEPVYHANWLHEDPHRLKKAICGLFCPMLSAMAPDGMLTFPTNPRRFQMDARTANVCTEQLSRFNMFLTDSDRTSCDFVFCYRIVYIASCLSMVPLTKAEAGV
jgi:hypothetical protein